MYCKNCGTLIEKGANFCGNCGTPIDKEEQTISQFNTVLGVDETVKNRIFSVLKNKQQSCLAALAACAILWLIAPFVAVNLATLDDMPTAFQILIDDVSYIGELKESFTYLTTIISGIAIIACIFCVIRNNYKALCAISFIVEVLMIMTFMEIYDFLEIEGMGFGFWGIFLLFAVVIILSIKKDLQESRFFSGK